MITCPWCGTCYKEFQPSCQKCGGPLLPPAPEASISEPPAGVLKTHPAPPPAPRPISDRYTWKLMLADGWSIASGVFGLVGGIFAVIGLVMTLAIVTAFVGIPFLLLGIVLLGAGAAVLFWRYQQAQRILETLRNGVPADGEIISVDENLNVEINQRHPWVIAYRFRVSGTEYTGNVTTLNRPSLQPGDPAWVLYLPQEPIHNALYPHP